MLCIFLYSCDNICTHPTPEKNQGWLAKWRACSCRPIKLGAFVVFKSLKSTAFLLRNRYYIRFLNKYFKNHFDYCKVLKITVTFSNLVILATFRVAGYFRPFSVTKTCAACELIHLSKSWQLWKKKNNFSIFKSGGCLIAILWIC